MIGTTYTYRIYSTHINYRSKLESWKCKYGGEEMVTAGKRLVCM